MNVEIKTYHHNKQASWIDFSYCSARNIMQYQRPASWKILLLSQVFLTSTKQWPREGGRLMAGSEGMSPGHAAPIQSMRHPRFCTCNFMGTNPRSPRGGAGTFPCARAQTCLAPGRLQLPWKLRWIRHRPADLPAPAHFRIGLPVTGGAYCG